MPTNAEPGQMADERTWQARAVPGCVAQIRRDVVEFATGAGVPNPPLNNLRLAVSEAVTNAVVHGYPDSHSDGNVTVHAEVRDRQICVLVTDGGVGMAPRLDSPGLGLGMPLIATLADQLDVRAGTTGGTQIQMMFCF